MQYIVYKGLRLLLRDCSGGVSPLCGSCFLHHREPSLCCYQQHSWYTHLIFPPLLVGFTCCIILVQLVVGKCSHYHDPVKIMGSDRLCQSRSSFWQQQAVTCTLTALPLTIVANHPCPLTNHASECVCSCQCKHYGPLCHYVPFLPKC